MSRITRIVLSSAVAIAIGASVAAVPVHAAPTSAPARPTTQTTYTVKPGDFLYGIAVKLKVRFNDLLAVNGLTKQSVIHPGDKLIVPSTPPSTPTASATLYTVKPGDYFTRIASALGVSTSDLLAVNNLKMTSVIHPGMKLKVPTGGVVPSTPAPTPATGGSLYTVKPGDYFKRIASALGVSMDDLLAVNGLKKTAVIYAGMKLKVPVGGVVPTIASGTPATVTTVLDFAMAQLGESYKFLGSGPDLWDCSGLTMRAYAAVGISLPHQSAAQAKKGQAVEWVTQGIRPGDLVFLATNGTISHVGIALTATTWIQSPGTGDVVRTSNIPFHRVVAVRRLVNGG
ncbi:MAG: LysM peptidoglycan-binding domain-containing protein [Ilumatobacteraceae bacterium]